MAETATLSAPRTTFADSLEISESPTNTFTPTNKIDLAHSLHEHASSPSTSTVCIDPQDNANGDNNGAFNKSRHEVALLAAASLEALSKAHHLHTVLFLNNTGDHIGTRSISDIALECEDALQHSIALLQNAREAHLNLFNKKHLPTARRRPHLGESFEKQTYVKSYNDDGGAASFLPTMTTGLTDELPVHTDYNLHYAENGPFSLTNGSILPPRITSASPQVQTLVGEVSRLRGKIKMLETAPTTFMDTASLAAPNWDLKRSTYDTNDVSH